MDVGKKLQLKPGQGVESVATPAGVQLEVPRGGDTVNDPVDAALVVFVADRATLERHRATIVDAASKDRLTWVSYPKAGQLGTDLNRDSLAALLAESGVQPVRQISIDGVWSALRFRPG
jgi:hypothetical protein